MRNRPFETRRDGLVTRSRLTVAGTALVLIVGVLIAIRTVDPREAISLVREADTWLLGAAFVAYVLSWPIRGQRYGDVLSAMDRRFSTRFLALAIFASQTANLVVPARAGDGLRAYLLNDRRAVSYPTGVASLAVERAFDLVALTTLGGAAFAFLYFDSVSVLSGESATGTGIGIGIGTAVLLLSVLTVVVARTDRAFGIWIRDWSVGPRLSVIVDVAVRFGSRIRVVANSPRDLATIYAGSVAIWALDILTAVLVLASLIGAGGGLSGWSLVAVGTLAVSVGNLAKVLPLSQGGIGLYEAAFTGLVVGVTPIGVEVAITAAILDHALKNGVTVIGGVAAGVTLNVSPRFAPSAVRTAKLEPPDY